MNKRIALYFAAAWAMFILASITPFVLGRAGLKPWFDSIPWLEHFVVKTVLVALAFAAMARDGRALRKFGFRGSAPWRRRLLIAGTGLGTLASLVVIATPARGMTSMFEGFGIVALVLSIWIYSSVTEEIFTRGWYQSVVTSLEDSSGIRGGADVASSAVLFGSMHLSLLWTGADLWTVAIIVVFTTLLGWVAAVARRQSRSLIPALLVHVVFNIGGFIAGLAYAAVTIARTGNPPAF